MIRQKHMSMQMLVIWMMIITTTQWIMLDMYLPALPVIKEEFCVSEAYLNITLNSGMVACALGTFIGGILSDHYGRKIPFIAGLAGAAAGCFASMFAMNVPTLAIFRSIGIFGSGVVLSVNMAIIKDSFEDERFNTVTTYLQSAAAVGPIIAPTLGAILINYFSWRYIFAFLGGLTLITLIPMLRLTETWPKERRVVTGYRAMWDQTVRFLKNRNFLLFMMIICLITIPVWAYLGVSSYVFINEFGLTNTQYGIYYAVGACISVVGPFIYIGLRKIMKLRKIVHISMILLFLAAALLLLPRHMFAALFLIGVIPVLIVDGILRPLGMVVILEEHASEAGTASSWMQFIVNIIGIVGTTVATLQWTSMAFGVGVITAVCAVLATIVWIVLLKVGTMRAFRH